METETRLAKDMETADIERKYDAAVKCLLADKQILAWILKECAEEFRDVPVEQIAEECIEGEPQISDAAVMPDETNRSLKVPGTGVEDVTMTEGRVVFDIRFNAKVPKDGGTIGIIVNVEAQNKFHPGYPIVKRGIYYCSRMISSQYGSIFTRSDYGSIKKVYSIWLCTSPPAERRNTITKYAITEQNCVGNVKENVPDYDLMTLVIVCLGNDGKCEGLLKLLFNLLLSEEGLEERKRVMSQEFGIAMTETVEGRLSNMCNLSEGVLERGIETGIERGIERGRQEGILQMIGNLMKQLSVTVDKAMELLGIPEDDRDTYRSLLESGIRTPKEDKPVKEELKIFESRD